MSLISNEFPKTNVGTVEDQFVKMAQVDDLGRGLTSQAKAQLMVEQNYHMFHANDPTQETALTPQERIKMIDESATSDTIKNVVASYTKDLDAMVQSATPDFPQVVVAPEQLKEPVAVTPYFIVGNTYTFIKSRPPGQGDRGFIFERKLELVVETSNHTRVRNADTFAVVLRDPKKPTSHFNLVESHSQHKGREVTPLFETIAKKDRHAPAAIYMEKGLFLEAMQRTLQHSRAVTDKSMQLRWMKSMRLTERMYSSMFDGELLFPRADLTPQN